MLYRIRFSENGNHEEGHYLVANGVAEITEGP